MTTIRTRTQLFAEGLPEGHPLRSKLASLLKEANIMNDLLARTTVLEGALGMTPGSLSRQPRATLPDIQQNFPDINPEFFEMRRDYDLYGAVVGGAGQIKGTTYGSDDIAQALIGGITLVNMDEVKGGSIYRRLGKKLSNAIKSGRVNMKGLAGTLRRWSKERAKDVIDTRGDVSIDVGFGDEGFDQASMIDRFYSDPGTSETALSISVVNKPGMLQTIDRAVRKELRGPGQEAVWDAVLNDPDLLNPTSRGMGIDQQPLAEAISQMTGTEISRQVAGRTFRDKVLPAMERALANDEKLQQTLMKDRDIQQVFQDAMRLARTAAWRGWTEDMPVQVVTMKGTEVFPNLAAAQKKYRDLNPDRQGKQFTWAMKGRVQGQTAIRFEEWAVNKMMSMSASPSLRERAIRLASENPELRRHLLPLLRHDQVQELVSKEGAEKAKTEEGAKKLHEEYMKGLEDPSKSTKKPEDFFEKGEGGEKKEEKKEEAAPPHHAKVNEDLKTLESDWEKIDPKKAEEDMRKAWGTFNEAEDRFDERADLAVKSVADTITGMFDKIGDAGAPRKSGEHLANMVKGLHSMAVAEGKGDAAKGYEKMGLGADYDPLKGREQTDADHAEGVRHRRRRAGREATLRTQLIRLAHENPELRASLLPLLKQGASWFDMFFKEKRIPSKVFEVKDRQGITHSIPNKVVIDMIKQTRGSEKTKIEETLREIDFKNGDVNHYLAHLAKGLAESYSGALRLSSEQEAEKFDAESEAAEDQSQADEAKAEAARVKEAAAKLKQAPQDTDFDIQF